MAVSKSVLKRLLLPCAVTIGVAIGVGLGLGLRRVEPPLTSLQISVLTFPGDLMLQMMKVLLLPITTSSIIVAMVNMDITTTGKIGLRALVYYMVTMLVGCGTGLAIAHGIKPGQIDNENQAGPTSALNTTGISPGIAIVNFIRNLFPDNLIEACFLSKAGYLVKIRRPLTTGLNEAIANSSHPNDGVNETDAGDADWRLEVRKREGTNLMGLLVFSIAFGCVLSTLGETGRPLYLVIEAIYHASIKLILIIVWYLPIGLVFLTAGNLVAIENPDVILKGFGVYFGIMLLCLFIHAFITLPLFYFAVTRKNPFVFIFHMFSAIFTAFATDSSAATIPVTIKCLEDNNHVDSRIARLMVPVGATVNMDGSALNLTIIGVFVANLHGIDLSAGQIITIIMMSMAIAIGAAATPGGGGNAAEILMLTSANLPITDIYMFIALNWLGGRFRTVVNVLGDAYGSGIVEKLSASTLLSKPYEETDNDDSDVNDITEAGPINVGPLDSSPQI